MGSLFTKVSRWCFEHTPCICGCYKKNESDDKLNVLIRMLFKYGGNSPQFGSMGTSHGIKGKGKRTVKNFYRNVKGQWSAILTLNTRNIIGNTCRTGSTSVVCPVLLGSRSKFGHSVASS